MAPARRRSLNWSNFLPQNYIIIIITIILVIIIIIIVVTIIILTISSISFVPE